VLVVQCLGQVSMGRDIGRGGGDGGLKPAQPLI
jgi:hypothetical protein